MARKPFLFDELLGVIEGSTAISHEDGSRNGNNCCSNQKSSDELYSKEKSSNHRDHKGKNRRE